MKIDKAYDLWSSQYDTNKNKTRDLDKLITQKILKEIRFSKVLELGCGTGKNTQWLSLKADEILAVDFSSEMLQIAKTKINRENVSFVIADITKDWDFISLKPDLITCNLILEHIEDLSFIFSSAYSCLKEDGYFFISELHPFKQYKGTKARFDTEIGLIELKAFTHHISEFIHAAKDAGFLLSELNEFFEEDDPEHPPRLISFLFQKPKASDQT
ncbi:class I SAM-dependent methyltransferase [Christiangramia salexigens]|uniref:SAM-dependent methyltransferase n=1 Tax=Christiangramia salexigens TaxID=1913577 RepID=A0A1L3J765_9FLAO|nr:class I SAM-dependent methyltransferase [Christiangramia salexigens]APG60951.1 SAM-dependent methyltransferase [Christiangramia salexigens]